MSYTMTITAVSSNTKTGPIPTISRGQETCPSGCPFLKNGCYGEGRIFGTTHKYQKPHDKGSMVAVLQKARKAARFLRDRVVGDLLDADGNIDYGYLRTVTEAAAEVGLRPFGYSHAWRQVDAAQVPGGYTLNASCETPEQVWDAIDQGLDAVIANDRVEDGTMINGKRVVTCPAQTKDGVTCASCGLCAKKDRTAVVRFLLHGPAVRKARAAVDAADLG